MNSTIVGTKWYYHRYYVINLDSNITTIDLSGTIVGINDTTIIGWQSTNNTCQLIQTMLSPKPSGTTAQV